MRQAATLTLLLAVLGGCQSRDPWAPYTTGVLMIGAFVPCGVESTGLPAGATYYHVVSPRLVADDRGIGPLQYFDGQSIRTEQVFFVWRRQWWQSAAAIPYGHVRCAMVWTIPWSTQLKRPYYLEDEPARVEARYGVLVSWHDRILAGMAVAFALGLVPIWFAYDADNRGLFVLRAVGALAVWMVCALVGVISVRQPWSVVERALNYYRFYDHVPKSSGLLRPLSAEAADRILRAPPLPTEIGFTLDGFAWTAGLLAATWLALNARGMVVGAYWLCTPLPLARQHARTVATGTVPTAEESMRTLADTLIGKSPWQLDVMRRKAKAFRKDIERKGTPPGAQPCQTTGKKHAPNPN